MPKKKTNEWPRFEKEDGVIETHLKSWREFHDVIQKFLDLPNYVFRGQRMADWLLEPSLARIIKGRSEIPEIMRSHLETFKLASRGRRGANPPELHTEDDWWSLGQHHGLATPLLDWSSSPYVALFFAFCDPQPPDQSDYCAVYALNTTRVSDKVDALTIGKSDSPEVVSFIRPNTDENSRLVAQAGMFSRSPINVDITSWVSKHFKGESSKVILMRVLIPSKDRLECLKALNIMNINHSTLFPDLYGAGKHTTELLKRKKA